MATLKNIVKTLNVPGDYKVYYSPLIITNIKNYPNTPIIMEEIDGVAVEFFLAVEDDARFLEMDNAAIKWSLSSACVPGASFGQYRRIK